MKVALWQTAGFPGDVAANLTALERVADNAAAAGTALLLCPECWLCGYNIGDAVPSVAETHDGDSAQRVAQIARRNAIAIAYGYAERDAVDGRIYNSVQVIGPDGFTLSRYRKTHLFGPFERSAFTPGSEWVRPFQLGEFRFGLLICYDVEFPEAVRTLALLGADAILVATATTYEYAVVTSVMLPARALESRVYVAYCNHVGVENGMRYLGGSCLAAPDGRVLVTAGTDDGLIFGELTKGARACCEALFPYLHDRRPELYQMLLRTDKVDV